MSGDSNKIKKDWYALHGCSHAHCPYGCEHPQPFFDEKIGTLLCGACWFKYGLCSVMVPCIIKEGTAPAHPRDR